MNVYALATVTLGSLKVGDFVVSKEMNPFYNAPACGRIVEINGEFVLYEVHNFNSRLRIEKSKLIGSHLLINDQKHLIK